MKTLSNALGLTLIAIMLALPIEARQPNEIDSTATAERVARALNLQKSGDYSEARQLLVDALREAPGSAAILDALGSVEQDLGRYHEAERCYLTALKASALTADDPQRLAILNNLGTLYLDTAQYRKAEEIREKLEKVVAQVLASHSSGLAPIQAFLQAWNIGLVEVIRRSFTIVSRSNSLATYPDPSVSVRLG